MVISLPDSLYALIEKAIAKWTPTSHYNLLKELKGGKSGAPVLLVDISPYEIGQSTDEQLSGRYILKLDKLKVWDPPEPNEYERHLRAVSLNQEFSKNHIPRLLRYEEDGGHTALLYEIAGPSLYNLITADSVDAGMLERSCSQLSSALLNDLNENYEVESGVTAYRSLEEWLGYRLNEEKAKPLHNFIQTETNGHSAFTIGKRVLINPLWFCRAEPIVNDSSHSRFIGLLHGDLHPGNFLLDRRTPDNSNFWLIDFALSRKGPLLYDHSYFELSLLIRHLKGADPERILTVLEALEADAGSPTAKKIPINDIGLTQCLRVIRLAAEDWQRNKESNRWDPFIAQQLLSRVAVSINWVNKDLTESDKRLALAYGALAAERYLKLFHEEESKQILLQADTRLQNVSSGKKAVINDVEPDPVIWSQIWDKFDGFNEQKNKYILVTGTLECRSNTPSLGFLPWSAVIDLDPESNQQGLYESVSPVLTKLRAVKQFGLQPQVVNFNKGTAWLMANGWPSRHEDVPETLKDWRQIYIPCIRDLCEKIRRSVSPQVTKILVLPGGRLSGAILERVLETLDIEFKELAQIILLGDEQLSDSSTISAQFSIQPEAFIAGVRGIYGTQDEVKEPEVPGIEGPVAISIDRLRNLEEDFDILHSRILVDSTTLPENQNDFWRGAPPTWVDLHAGVDVERDIHEELTRQLKDLLSESNNRTLELHHSPGAGGTTAALRAAWALHIEHPTIILRRKSKLTVDRIDELFHLTQRPILIIADELVLATQAREDLYRSLVERNTKAVILHVSRTLSARKPSSLSLISPMEKDEAQKFYEIYSTKTNSNKRREKLRLITSSDEPKWTQCRSPFFYGLITYDRNFISIDRYVDSYLKDASYGVRKVMTYVALVTRFSQTGISYPLFNCLLGLKANSNVTLDEAVGLGPANLIQRQTKQVRLLHPLIAEEVLRQLIGGQAKDKWEQGLKDLVMDFIREVGRILGSDSEELNHVFEQLFIRRDDWFRPAYRRHFSELIYTIPSVAGQHQIFQLLTEVCPSNSHFWNHLGRHHIYEMKLDFTEAEEYLEKAVDLDPEDKVHHHSLGMVRRFWLEDTIKRLLRETKTLTNEELLNAVKGLFDSASFSFTRAREIDPNDDHGYITHTQMIIYIIERFTRNKDKNSGVYTSSSVESWVQHNLVIAEDLLGHIQHLRADSKPSRYELKCVGGLNRIYGNFDETIKYWKSLLGQFREQSDLRRALVHAYHSKYRRSWSSLPQVDLEHIADLMEDNLREDPTNEHDIRMWFQAYRRLPEFSYLNAIDRLEAWSSRSESAEAYYYLYILQFLLWWEGQVRDEDQLDKYLKRCRQLASGKKGHSYEWLGVEPPNCPLVNHKDLGEFNTQLGFYPNTEKLAFCSGSIEVIKPKSGSIRMGKVTRAFFVPGTKFRESTDLNALVHFYLGFSYDGLRAWSVDFGPAPNQEDIPRRSQIQEDSTPLYASLYEQVKAFIIGTLQTPNKQGRIVALTLLGTELQNAFQGKAVYERLGYKTLTALLQSIEEVVIESEGNKRYVWLRHDLEIATLRERVKEFIISELTTTGSRSSTILLTDLGLRLRKKFPGDSVYRRLGYGQLTDLLSSYRELLITGYTPKQAIGLREGKHPA